MKRIIIPNAGKATVLKLEDVPSLTPKKGEVRIKVKACGVNFADVLARQGLYPDAPPFPACVGYEVSGIVDALGQGVDDSWLGKAVFGMTRFNGYAEEVVVPLDQIFDKPEKLSFEQAAAIPVNYLTAWQLLVVMGSLQSTDRVLIHNAGGGVGLAALDIARHIGATTIGTASPGKHEFLTARGLNHAIDYRNKDWRPEVKQLTNGEGVDLIIDPLGGAHWKWSYKALRSTGRMGMFGISTAAESNLMGKLKLLKVALQMPFFHPVSLMNDNKSVFGVNMGHLWHESGKIRLWMDEIITGVEAEWINPHVDKTFRFSDASEAHLYLEERKNKGKVLLIPDQN